MGNSDIREPCLLERTTPECHRPTTLVFAEAVEMQDVGYDDGNVVRFGPANDSDIALNLERAGSMGPKELSIPANGRALVKLKVPSAGLPVELSYVARNLVIGPKAGLPVRFVLPGQIVIPVEALAERASQE